MKTAMKKNIILLVLIFSSLIGNAQDSDDSQIAPFSSRTTADNWLFGFTMGWDITQGQNLQQVTRLAEQDRNTNFDLKLEGAYSIRDYMFVGLGFGYGLQNRRGKYTPLGSSTLSDIQIHRSSYSFRPYIKNYLPISRNERFNLMVLTELYYNLDQGIEESNTEQIVTRNLSRENSIGIGISPGIMAMVIRNFGVEAYVNAAGWEYSKLRTEVTDQEPITKSSSDLSFKISLLEFNLGLLFYFN